MKFLYILVAFVLFFSCKKDQYLDDSSAKLIFSTDTVKFDTVLTTVGSITKSFKVYNPYKKNILIRSIYLSGNNLSPFRLNIDGENSNNISDITIRAKDSIFIFVAVTLPQGKNNVEGNDFIVFNFNENNQQVCLSAWFKDVIRIDQSIRFASDTTLGKYKNYLFFKPVFISAGATLTIREGTELYFHKGAGLIIEGKIKVEGTKSHPVIFANDRLDVPYDSIPGQWDGIYINSSSKDNSFNYTKIVNAVNGIQIGSIEKYTNHPGITLSNTVISTMSHNGITSYGADIKAWNCIFADCGYNLLYQVGGGKCDFFHSNFINFYTYNSRTDTSVLVSNYVKYNSTILKSDLNIAFNNCIIYGYNQEEIQLSPSANGVAMNYMFNHCLLKTQMSTSDQSHFVGLIVNQDPMFEKSENQNYRLQKKSPAKDKAEISFSTLYSFDLDSTNRMSDALPDIGAYELK